MNKRLFQAVSIIFSLIGYGGMVLLHWQTGTLRAEFTPITIALYTSAFIGYVAILIWAERQKALSTKWVWGGAVLFRILLLFTVPTLSDDVYRYIWDGHIALNGVSPYALPLDSPALDHLNIPLRALANNTWMASPYLPSAQYLFVAIVALFKPQTFAFQLIMVILDLLSGLLLSALLNLARLPAYRTVIYLWNPLVIVEIAHSAHVDAWMLFLTALALWLTFYTNPLPNLVQKEEIKIKAGILTKILAPLIFALAVLSKALPILILPVLFWLWNWKQIILFVILIAALLIPPGLQAGWGLSGPLDGTGVFGALRIYENQWNFNSGFFHWFEDFLAYFHLYPSNSPAKIAVALFMIIVLGLIWLKGRSIKTPRAALRLMAYPFMAYLLLTPTVHPWYSLILLLFLPFLPPANNESKRGWLAVLPWLYLSYALIFSYLTYRNPLDFREFEWVRRLEWLPVYGLILLWGIERLRDWRLNFIF